MSNVTEAGDESNSSIAISKKTASPLKDAEDTPRILCNELLVKPSVDHLDELSSLEREIAKIHNVEESVESTQESTPLPNRDVSNSGLPCRTENDEKGDAVAVDGTECTNDDKSTTETFETKQKSKADPAETALEHEDLIAVLKGLDDVHNVSGGDAELMEGVTIEGEGEYQIMEVVDDEYTTAAPDHQESAPLKPLKSSNVTKTFGAAILTTEEERALALEQMECLKIKPKPRRRKQDIKPIQQSDPVMDLVSSLEAEWTDNDDDVNKESATSLTNSTPSTNSSKNETSVPAPDADKSNGPQITSVVVIPPSCQIPNSIISTSVSTDTKTINSTSTDSESNEQSLIDGAAGKEEPQKLSNVSGFRRTRIIKRKIIWDPDAPETTFSYAKLVTPNKAKVKTEPTIPTTTITKGSTTIRPIKKETSTSIVKKTQRPATPKDKKSETGPNVVDKKSIAIPKQLTSAGIEAAVLVSNDGESDNKTQFNATTSSSQAADISPSSVAAANKRRSQTPVSNGPGGTKKKKITEIDRLMGDEGAVNMLNSLEKMEATLGIAETKSTRPMMRSRAATICEKIPLRKEHTSPVKTSPPSPTTSQPANKSGKRTPKSRASSSWDYVYKQKQQNLDDSMIIRRRSNSSYSSTASLNRLSLDGPPTATNGTSSSTKVNESKPAASANTVPAKISSEISDETPTPSSPSLPQSRSAGAGPKNSAKTFEFAKPENKKTQRRTKSPAGTLASDLKKPAPVANKRNVRSPANATTTTDDKADGGGTSKSQPSTGSGLKDKLHTSDVVVKKSSKVTQIIFSTNKAKLSNTFTTQMLNKLSDILDKLAADPDTHVIIMTTNDAHFCQGIDLTELTLGSAEKRKNAIKHLSAAVKNYIKTLATFPKPLIAGVNGHVMNLGVMQLAFFDIVVAGDKCTYETPYAKMGQVPEGYSVWNGLNKIRGSFKTKLFWLSEKIQSTEAALAGLVNKLTTGNKVNDEALSIAKRIASMSPESYRVMKKTVSRGYFDIIDESFNEEFNTIAEQWSSSEFLDNIKKYIDQGHF